MNTLPKNSCEEFFDVLLQAVASQEAQKLSLDLTKDIDNPLLTESIESSMNVLVFSLLFNAVKSSNVLKLKKSRLSKIGIKRIRVKAHKSRLRSKNKRYKVLERPYLFDRLNLNSFKKKSSLLERLGLKGLIK